MQMQMFERVNRQQQPFIQSGYGAMGRLNTLLGLGSRSRTAAPTGEMPLGGNATLMPRGNHMYRPTPNGGIQQLVAQGPQRNPRLNQILALRAANGDSEAARMLQGMM